MGGISIIDEHGKKIYLVDFAGCENSKEATVRLIEAAGEEFAKSPMDLLLAIFDVGKAFFHFETFKHFRLLAEKGGPQRKKVAVVGFRGLQKAGFNFIIDSKDNSVKAFDSIEKAKEWLCTD